MAKKQEAVDNLLDSLVWMRRKAKKHEPVDDLIDALMKMRHRVKRRKKAKKKPIKKKSKKLTKTSKKRRSKIGAATLESRNSTCRHYESIAQEIANSTQAAESGLSSGG